MSPKPKTADRLIVALDVDTTKKALDIIEDLNGLVSFFKVGYQLFIAEGTVKTHVKNLLEKLAVVGRTAAIREAVHRGLVRLN